MITPDIPLSKADDPSPSVVIAWGSTTGFTEDVAVSLFQRLETVVEAAVDIALTTVEELTSFDVLILGVPTWHIGQLQDDWQEFQKELAGVDLTGKVVALFGCGDARGYPDNFQDAMGVLWQQLEAQGARLIGRWPTAGYDFEQSCALTPDGEHFVGLAIDEHGQGELTQERLDRWAEQLRQELASLHQGYPASLHAWVH